MLAGAALVAGCAATSSRAPVLERSEPATTKPPETRSSGEYIVRPKDSLYAIAWKYQLDYRAIARRNGIEPPYTIYPGQKLLLYGMDSEAPPVASVPKTPGKPTAAPVAKSPGKPTAAPATPKVAAHPAPVQPIPKPVSKPVPAPKPKPTAAPKTVRSQPGAGGWRWPVSTQPARGFGRGNNGLDYVIPTGQEVVAVAAGEVVYADAGLGGYRHLIIVEHAGNYLSAYNINVEPAVTEGSRIAGGGKICDIGSGSPATRRLHFEIRRNGTPVDPAKVIGRR